MRTIELKKFPQDFPKRLVRFGDSSLSASVPEELAGEAQALLFAISQNPNLWTLAPEFNTQELNPFFGVPPTDLYKIATIEKIKAPWVRTDIDVTASFNIMDNSEDPAGMTPVLITKGEQPMEHLALLARLSEPHSYQIKLEFAPEHTSVYFFSTVTKRVFLSYMVPLNDPATRFIQKMIATREYSPRFIFAVPKSLQFWKEIKHGFILGRAHEPLALSNWRLISVSGMTITEKAVEVLLRQHNVKDPTRNRREKTGKVNWSRLSSLNHAEVEALAFA